MLKQLISMDVAFVDLQGFRGENKQFIPKEVAVISADGNNLAIFILKPPENYAKQSYNVKKSIKYLENKHHGLAWTSGSVNFEEFHTEVARILENFEKVYVKGQEKKEVLSFLNKTVVNLEDLECPSLKVLKKRTVAVRCLNHNIREPFCALENVLILSDWWRNEYTGSPESATINSDSLDCETTCFCL